MVELYHDKIFSYHPATKCVIIVPRPYLGPLVCSMEDILKSRDKAASAFGWTAAVIGLLLWLTLADQIRLNLSGQKGSVILAMTIVANCIAWVGYGLLKNPRDWKLVIANSPGILLGIVAVYTALF